MIAKFDDGYIYLAKLLALNVDLLFKDDPFSERFGPIWESLGQVPGGRIKFAGAFAGVKELEESAQKYANNKYEEGEALPGMLTKIWLWLADNPDPSNAPAERLILRQIMNTDLRVLLLMMNIWLKDSTSCCNYLTVLGKQIEDVRKHTKTPVRQEMFITLMARLRELATQPAPDNARIAQGIFNLLSSCYKKEELAAAFIAGEKSGHAFEAVFIGDNGYKNLLALAIESDQINLAEVIIQAAQNIDVNLLPKMLEHCDKDGQTALSMIQKGDGRFNEIREMLGVSGKGCSIA